MLKNIYICQEPVSLGHKIKRICEGIALHARYALFDFIKSTCKILTTLQYLKYI